jgi:hypothetical protein
MGIVPGLFSQSITGYSTLSAATRNDVLHPWRCATDASSVVE